MNSIFNHTSEDMSEIADKSVSLVVTSPPYNINVKYGYKWENGRQKTTKGVKYEDNLPEAEYRTLLGRVFNEIKRVLSDNGQIWVNIKNRYLNGVIVPPFWVMDYFQDMYLKNVVIWNFDWGGSTNRRFCSRYEYLFLITKKVDDYTFNLDDVKVPASNYRPDRYKSQWKNPTDVWQIPMVKGNSRERTGHPAQYPEALVERIIKVGSNPGDLVLDPFIGSGTTAVVAKRLGRKYVGYELSTEYIDIANKRLENEQERLF